MKRVIKLYLKDILDSIKAIENFTEGMDFESFKSDDKTSNAVIRKFEIIGEATRNIPQKIRRKYSEIPWKEMVGFRDKLIHFYFGIKYEIVWDTIKLKLPELKTKTEKVIKDIPTTTLIQSSQTRHIMTMCLTLTFRIFFMSG